jgi:hypothetical protein
VHPAAGKRCFSDAIEKPSANTFEKPKISTMLGFKFAPAIPAMIAKVVTVPSIDPYTNSGKY